MSQMSFVDEMKDKAARLIPTPYTDIVAEATSDILLVPDMEKITFICDSANLKEDNAVDVIRAVRRRIDNKSPKVQAFTIVLLEKLIKECGAIVHIEIAETKGLLRDLVNIAVKVPSRDGEREAKKAALTLILNMSIWFSAAASNEKLRPLLLLADETRKLAGEGIFEGIDVDTNVRLKRVAAPQQRERNQEAFQRAQQREYLRLQRMHQQQQAANSQPRVVAAIPVIIPTDEEVSAMLDSCLLLAECLNTAESSGASVIGDEIIAGIAAEIRKQHRNVTILVSSGADIPNMEMLLSVVESQSAVVERLSDMISIQGRQLSEIIPVGTSAPHQSQAPPPPTSSAQQPAPRSPPPAVPPAQKPVPPIESVRVASNSNAAPAEHRTSTRNRHGVRSAADVDDALEMEELPETGSIPSAPVPTMDDIFGGATASAAAPAAATASRPAAFPAPVQSVDHTTKAGSELTHTEAPLAQPKGSLNADNDDFDSFLNDRLAKH